MLPSRLTIAMKRRCPQDVLLSLAKDGDGSVRLAVAKHSKVSMVALGILAGDSWDEIRVIAKARLGEGGGGRDL
jgi:hypothetical protein